MHIIVQENQNYCLLVLSFCTPVKLHFTAMSVDIIYVVTDGELGYMVY